MEDDWYVDPLGRYEGRYFDGEDWTDQVKEEGRLAVDPDWNRAAAEVAAAAPQQQSGAVGHPMTQPDRRQSADVWSLPTPDVVTEATPHVEAVDEVVDAEIIDPRSTPPLATPVAAIGEVDRVEAEVVTPKFDTRSPKAVEPVIGGAFGAATAPRTSAPTTDFSSESPTRQVAVLGDDATAFGSSTNTFDLGGEPPSRRWMYLLGALVLAVALAVVLLPRLFGGDDELADPVDGTDVAVQPSDADVGENAGSAEVELLPAGDAAGEGSAADGQAEASSGEMGADESGDGEAALTEPGERVLAGPDSIAVGGLEVLNGKPSLTDLAGWHRSSLGAAAASLPDDATCWFGRLGDAVVQNAHCGPVAASTPEEVRFDLIPLKFEDISESVIQVRALTDAVISDAALPNGLVLVGLDGELDPASFESAPAEPEARTEEDAPAEEAPAEEAPAGEEAPATEEPATDEPEDSGRGGRGSRTVEDE